MKIAPLLLAAALLIITATSTAAQPAFKVIQLLPAVFQGHWCYSAHDDDSGVVQFERCKAVSVPNLTITTTSVARETTSCRLGAIFAWLDVRGWNLFAECRGPADDNHIYQMMSIIGEETLGIRAIPIDE
jgi:hypothetical protein